MYAEVVPRACCRRRLVYRTVLTVCVCSRSFDRTQVTDNGAPYDSSFSTSSLRSRPLTVSLSLCPAAVFVQHRLLSIQNVSSNVELYPFHKHALQCRRVYIPRLTIRTTLHCGRGELLLKQRPLTGLESDPAPRPWSLPWGQFTTCQTLHPKRSPVLYENGLSKGSS